MPTRAVDRLMFAQGGQCFFCRRPLPKAEATVEHLIAQTHGGKDNDENCVVCCKSLNNLFGRMSLKEKLHILLNQKGPFLCPAESSNRLVSTKIAPAKANGKAPRSHAESFKLVVADLQKRGNARPGTVDTLLNTIRNYLTQLGESAIAAEAILEELFHKKYVIVTGTKVTYALPPRAA